MSKIPLLPALAALAFAFLVPAAARAEHPGQAEFLQQLAERHPGVDSVQLAALLDQAERKQSIIDAMKRPAESLSWAKYRKIFMTPTRIAAGKAFLKLHRDLLEKVAARHQMDPEYIVAIIGVETNYGLITGDYRVLDALVTLSFYYPPRAEFFRGELEKLLTMPATQLPGSLIDIRGSYAGAMGWGQFIPSSIAAYARDEDQDGHIDLMRSLPDIFGSVANYFAQHGWQPGAPVALPATRDADAGSVKVDHSRTIHTVGGLAAEGYHLTEQVPASSEATLLRLDGAEGEEYWITFDNFYVITRYNHSPLYAMAVHQLASAIAGGKEQAADSAVATAEP